MTRILSFLVLLGTLVYLAVGLAAKPFDGSLMSLLTGEDRALEERAVARLNAQMMFLTGSGAERAESADAADALKTALDESGLFSELDEGPSPELLRRYAQDARTMCTAFVDDKLRAKIQSGAQGEEAVAALYLGFGAAGALELKSDPLLLTRAVLTKSAAANLSKIRLEHARYVVGEEHEPYRVLMGTLKDEALVAPKDTVAAVNAALQEVAAAYPGVRILKRGALFYSERAQSLAERDLTVLGGITVAGVVLLMLISFKSLVAPALTALSIICAIMGGMACTLLVFGRLHLVIMVLGLSVIGICTDYTVYFLTRRLQCGERESPFESVRFLRSELLMALATTVAAYLIVMSSPFPALRQLAVFCIAGLTYAMICVFNLEPLLCRGLKERGNALHASVLSRVTVGEGRTGWGILALVTALALAGLTHLKADDDPMAMQALPADLKVQEDEIASLTALGADQKWILLEASDENTLIHRLEDLRQVLERDENSALLEGALVPALNSRDTQRRDRELIAKAAEAQRPALAALGIELDAAPYAEDSYVSAEEFLRSSLGASYRKLWFAGGGQDALMIPVTGLADAKALKELLKAVPGASLCDRRADFTELFKDYRVQAQHLVALALGLILLVFLLRLGVRRGLLAFVPSLLSLLAALGIPALLGMSCNLFSVMALLLVLGIGIDYVLFFANGKSGDALARFATTVAMLTTVLSLGVLSLSATAVIRAFGLTLSAGIITAWLAAPMSSPNFRIIRRDHEADH